ncbi:hypothetical protein ACQ4LE_007501 [Meloidogyne hapla]
MYLPLNNFNNGKIISNLRTNNRNCSSKHLCLLFLTFIFCLYFFIQIWTNNSFINYKDFNDKKLINPLSIDKREELEECIENDKNRNDTKWSSECCGEKMAYSVIIETNDKLTQNILCGRRFDCKHLPLIHKYKLADKYKIQEKISVKRPGSSGFTIVTASNDQYFDTLKKLLYILKQKFGCSQKIIGYDLGGISENKTMMNELNKVCLLEWRKFDWNIITEDIHSLKAYAWKAFVIAEIYSKYDTFVYMDTSIVIDYAKSFNPLFDAIEDGKISETIFPPSPIHSIQFGTNYRTYTYLPLATQFINWDNGMYEANFIILHKSEYTRKLLKWSLLCSATKQCIEPDYSFINCSSNYNRVGDCHRYDQSAFAIISANGEYQRSILYPEQEFIPHFHGGHPRRQIKFSVQRYKKLDGNLDFVKGVECCQNN